MSRLTIFEVKDAIKHLEATGQKPSVLNIRKLLGHGSYSSITKFFKEIEISGLEPSSSVVSPTEASQPKASQPGTSNSALPLSSTHENQSQDANKDLKKLNQHTENLAASHTGTDATNQLLATGALIRERQQEVARLRRMVTEAEQELKEVSLQKKSIEAENAVLERLLTAVIINGISTNIPGDLRRALATTLNTQAEGYQQDTTSASLKKLTEMLKIFLAKD